jgi:hypothetical protein
MKLATLALAALGIAGASAGAQRTQPAGTEWHVVQQGETLEGLTERYLGDASLWRENWRLNPGLKDPHRLQPGERILIYTKNPRSAEIKALSRRVEAQPRAQAFWQPARIGETLRERAGLRTYERSSADLAFSDGANLLVTERSLVFLREAGDRLVGDVTPRTLEVVEGQADLDAHAVTSRDAAYEIVIGGSRSEPRAAAGEGPTARLRKADAGAAQLMVYTGEAAFEARGRQVEVPAGMGSVAPRDGAPTPPEKLLPAPRLLGPRAGEHLDHANPRFTWQTLPGAARYVVEVCRDPACAQLVERAAGVTQTRWTADDLPVATLYVRVTAVGASGLDGFPSAARPFSVDSLWRRP